MQLYGVARSLELALGTPGRNERLPALRALQVLSIHVRPLFGRDAVTTVRAGGIQGRVNLFEIELAAGRHFYGEIPLSCINCR